ncbi:MAG TPA: sulfotransferase, partial [Solirubrobacterales bacterium]|nr:sulfotransferase [Solirubrobacterales bacterium]
MDRFVVGTGRCGSTLLSQMLARSPQLCSIFEFFNGLDMTRRFSPEPVSGAEFASLISPEHPFVTMVISRGYHVPEIVYPYDDPRTRYGRGDRLPYLLVTALPRLCDHPDGLFDETLAFAAKLPHQPLARHYRALFDWWTQLLGREVWLERSGSSIDYVASLRELFPDARFVHLHRDGREAALSMREHHAFRLAIGLSFQVLDDRVHSLDELDLDPGAAADASDPISRMLEARPDASWFGRFWTGQIQRGMAARRDLAADRYLELRFEDLVARPQECLGEIAAFFELDPERSGWIRRAAALIRGLPPARRG